MPPKKSRKTPPLSMAKKKISKPSGGEITVPRHSVKKREQESGLQTKSPKKLDQAEQGHEDILTHKVPTEEPDEALLDLQEKVAINPQAPDPVTMATRFADVRKSQALSGPVTTAMDEHVALARNNQASSGPQTRSMSTQLLSVARKSQSSPGPMTTHLATARKSQSSNEPLTKAVATCLTTERKSVTARATELAIPRKTKLPSRPVTGATAKRFKVAKKDDSLSDSVTTAMETGLAVTRKSQSTSDLTTVPTATYLVAAKKSRSESGQVMAATSTQLAVTNKSQSSSCSMTTDLVRPVSIDATEQSPTMDTSNIKQPVTETTKEEQPVPKDMAKNRQITKKKRPEKQVRFSIRLTESSSRFKDIVVRKQDGFTHIFLSTKSSKNNSLNFEVMKEVQDALKRAADDDSKLVLLSAIGNIFCFGLDFDYFIQRLRRDKKRESTKMAGSIKSFVNSFIQFKKPIIVAVNGPAIGLGASILPLCDIVWANDKAWFQTPYTTFGQTPDGCSSYTFPKTMGEASANEMLLSGQKLSAQEACKKGLVAQVFWPQTFTQEVMIRIKELIACNTIVLEESKALLRFNTKTELEQANERECTLLKNIWGSEAGINAMLKYLENKIEY